MKVPRQKNQNNPAHKNVKSEQENTNESQKKKVKRYFELDKPDSKTDTKTDEVKVYNVKVTPRILWNQKQKDQKRQFLKNEYGNTFSQRKQKKKYPGKAPIDPKRLEKHSRGEGLQGIGVRNPIHKLKLQKKEKLYQKALEQAARSEILLTEDQGYVELEDEDSNTRAINQQIIARNIDIAAATKIFELNLDFGPYRAKYSRNGRYLLLGSKKGHLASFDWVTKKLNFEINVMESIHDISWLHIETMVAAAQKDWLYIYDNTGTELHCVKTISKVLKMEFLPYHFLLASVNEYGFLSWLDISIGEIAGECNSRAGRPKAMTHNPYNATLCLGDSKGVVSLWAPTVKEPLAKILCHKTPVSAISVDNRGLYMATSGVDRSIKIWDIRNLDGPLQHYKVWSPPVDLDFSQKDMLAVGFNETVEIYSNCCTQTVSKPYLRHKMAKTVNNFKFCPFEDVLGIGTDRGFTSIIVPGSGEPNFDALESNPFQTKKQRKEAEVKALLEKIPAELITLNPFEVTEVDVPTMKDIIDSKKKLLHVKPKKVDMTPRRKNKGQTHIARKKIIKDAARRDHIEKLKAASALYEKDEQKEKPVRKQSFGVLDRFVSNPTKSKK
ncbi:WD repeat-containing protein 46 [Bombyx mori]|uniref:BING4 C-terminal domain-containing protein n=1 Tax=Bombyx mori TaxID=7091 RepID=A0A8R2AKL1_BOMMO|nr:WD repeat-containing protein 46 [Bombyx mori]